MDRLKVGDLVETCALIPGFVVYINKDNPNNIEVQAFDKHGKYVPGYGACHNVKNCGVHKISTKRAMMLCALGNERLEKLWDDPTFDYYSDEALEKEFLKLRQEQS